MLGSNAPIPECTKSAQHSFSLADGVVVQLFDNSDALAIDTGKVNRMAQMTSDGVLKNCIAH
jgi:hypothetical protein